MNPKSTVLVKSRGGHFALFRGGENRDVSGLTRVGCILNQMVNKMRSYGQIVGIKCLSYIKLESMTKKKKKWEFSYFKLF